MKGIVIKSTGSWYQVLIDGDKIIDSRLKGSFRMNGIKNTNPIAVGDHVELEMQEGEDTAVINKIEVRKNYIIRKSINLSKQSHIIASNIDQAFLVVTISNPRTSSGFIDRFLLTAKAYQIPVNILFNKMDLYNEKEITEVKNWIEIYRKVGYPCLAISATKENDMNALKELMKDKTNLFSGHSGVGKSTLVNKIEPDLKIKVGEISNAHSKGIHTTTFAEMHLLSIGGFIIDTPGIKELGIVDMKKEEVSHFFPEMSALIQQCKFNNCLHLNEPKCAVIEAVKKGEIALSRYTNYLSIINGEEMEITW